MVIKDFDEFKAFVTLCRELGVSQAKVGNLEFVLGQPVMALSFPDEQANDKADGVSAVEKQFL